MRQGLSFEPRYSPQGVLEYVVTFIIWNDNALGDLYRGCGLKRVLEGVGCCGRV